MQKIYVLPSCWSCLHTQGTTTCGGQNTHVWATSAWGSLYSSTILEYTHFFSSLEWTCNIIFGIVQHVFCNQILYSQLLFHTESYNNFIPGATIHLCKQTQISPLTVDYWKDRHLNLSNCITLHNLLSGVLKNNSPSMWNSYVSSLGHIRKQLGLSRIFSTPNRCVLFTWTWVKVTVSN